MRVLPLDFGSFKENIFSIRPHRVFGGFCYVFKFSNGYGASVVKHQQSVGYEDNLWELATIKFDGDKWNLVDYHNPNCIDEYGIDDAEVRDYLQQIKTIVA